MAHGYQVDVDRLEVTVRKLRAVADSLDEPISCTRYNTAIPSGMLGTGFNGASALASQHDQMRAWLEQMIGELQSFIDTYGSQTKQVAANYTEQEQQTRQNFFSAGQNM